MLNSITLMGRLTKDPELRYTQSQNAVATFTLACADDFDKDKTLFIDCVAWKKTADFVKKYFTKGQLAVVHGRLQSREYEDKNGNNRKITEVVIDNIYFCEKKQTFDELEADDGELPFC